MTAMTASNGDSTFAQSDPTTSLLAPHKRKRSESADELSSNTITGGAKQLSAFSQRLQNALPLLHKYVIVQNSWCAQIDCPARADPTPSLLNHPLSLSGERSPKRPRYSSENLEADCISARIQSEYYHSPGSLLADVDSAVTSLILGLQSGENAIHDADSISRAANQINLFKQSLGKVRKHIAESDAKVRGGNGVEGDSFPGRVEEIPRPAVLTLAVHAEKGPPKPLYSGLQRQNEDRGTREKIPNSNHPDELQTLDPESFPNGIALTQLPPSNVIDQAGSAKQKRNFSDVFRPHRSLKALEPPRPSRNATRGSSLGWVNHEDTAGSERPTPAYKSDYRYASLPTGSWLHYSGAEGSAASDSDSKRRQRDRALSFGESRPEPLETVEHEQAKTRALFQSAYSSFAPAFDNSTAVVPEKKRSQAWCKKIGQKRFHALVALQYPESDLDGPDTAVETMDQAEDGFEAAIADFEQDTLQHSSQDRSTADADPKDVDEVLQEISDLLQTLSSYQRIRNLSKMNSGPATPTSAETDVYEVLRSNLSILVNSLPPYAVAKLNGDQLETLNVSTNIVIDMKDHVGTMEPDEYSMQRQRVSMAATQPATARASVSTAPTSRPGNYSAQSVNRAQRSSYASTPRTPYVNQPRPTAAYGNTDTPQPQTYSAARPAPMSSQRSSLPNQQHLPNQTYSHGPSTAPFQRSSSALQNGYGPSYAQNVHSQAYAQPRQTASSYSYPSNQSPPSPVQSPQPVPNAQQQYIQPPQKSQISSSVTYAMNNQVTMTEQARAQLQAQRQLSGTPQTPNINGQYAQMARSSTPGGGTPNGRPAVAAGASGGGQ